MVNLAIISTNRNKYSETFIRNHVKLLAGNIHFLVDGYLPVNYSIDRGKSFNSILNYFKTRKNGIFKKIIKWKAPSHLEALEFYLFHNNITVVLCEYGPSGVELMKLSKKLKIPLIVHFHGFDAYRNDILNSYGLKYKEMFQIALFIIVVSKHMYQQLINLGCPENKLKLIIYGIDNDIFHEKQVAPREISFVFCGRFVEKKGPQFLIEAFAQLLQKKINAKLIMIGDGELLNECIELAGRFNIQKDVIFKGALSQLEIAKIYSTSLVYVQHSILPLNGDSEGTPISILEAMASGLPVISTIHGGITDVIKDEKTGFLITEKDVITMVEKMHYLANQPEIAKQMGKNAASLIKKKYTICNYSERINLLIQQAAEESSNY